MLTTACYRLLASSSLPDGYLRLFLVLMSEHDLRNFRLLNTTEIFARLVRDHEPLKYSEDMIPEAIDHFVRIGILEEGPRINLEPTYRIRAEWLLGYYELRRQEQDITARREREAMAMW